MVHWQIVAYKMNTHLFRRRFVKAIMLLEFVTGASGFLDFTCFSAKPRIAINGDDDMLIGGYKSGSDTDATVSFGRSSNTGTSFGLPPGSSQRDLQGVSARVLDMPHRGGVERIGAFYCNANKNGVMERITTVIMSTSSEVKPREMSHTVSVGEPVTFAVDKNDNVLTLAWRDIRGDFIYSQSAGTLYDQDTYTIPNVTTQHAGIYECFQYLMRDDGIHAIFLLVVRACPRGKWNPRESCNENCSACFNGGICDERSGECVCAPGFSGQNCKTVHGRNRWGQDGQLQCSGSDDHGYGCQGNLFCLPHPYGCSCAAGFKGLDCDQECDEGTYGANCKLSCNCAQGVSCLKDTGECEDGQCHPDWHGVNCQDRCPSTDMPPPDMSSFENNIGEITSSTVVIQIPETDSEFATHSWSEGADVTLIGLTKDDLTDDTTPTSFLAAIVVMSLLLFIMLTVLLTMAFKIRSLKKIIKVLQSKTTVASTIISKPDVGRGEIVMSSDGYVEYKVSQQEDSTYQDLGDDQCGKQQGSKTEYAYVNESVVKKSKTDNDCYEVVGNK